MRFTTVIPSSWLALALLAVASALPQRQVPLLGAAPVPLFKETTPVHGTDVPSTPERRAEMAGLLDKYAPVFKLSKDERFFPSSVEFMLEHYGYVQYKNGTWYEPKPEWLTAQGLDQLPNRGKKQLLSVDVPFNAQPLFPDDESSFMYGPAGQDGGMEPGPDGRGRVHDEVYGFWVDQGRGVVAALTAGSTRTTWARTSARSDVLGTVSRSCWKRLILRTVDGVAVSADFNTHSGGKFSAGTYRWSDMELIDDRPVAYVASGSHGIWPTPGKHVYAQLLNLWALVDVTDDYGPIWDSQGHVVPIEYWTGPDGAKKVNHTGDLSWLQFRGAWGNKGQTGCWWHALVGICQVVDGPPGPNRRFGQPPDCIISPKSEKVSTYSFYLSQNVTTQAEKLNVTTVVIEQVCARPRAANFKPDEDPWATALDEKDLDIWVQGETIQYRGLEQHSGFLPACDGSRSVAKAYRISLWDDDGYHVSTSGLRVICIYEEGRPGYVVSGGAHVEDLDEWRWWLLRPTPN
ncbi:Vacuolar protein sorting-associated protein 62 [Vanrija albida]|uniref:Vacuolar protein sorting-associated protein 62 n=1 Tax=Vanrija albida TaxID=181172 RepID=A0ABR3PU19_9TREE